MKKAIGISVLLMAFVSLFGQTPSKKTEEYVLNRVLGIYNEYIHRLTVFENSLSMVSFSELYCSEEWNSLNRRVCNKEEESGNLFFDYDYWIDAQDYTSLRVDEVTVETLADNLAIVSVKLSDLEVQKKIYLVLCYERDDWFVNDFIHSLKGSMQDFLNSED